MNNMQGSLFNISANQSDVVYTPTFASKQIIDFLKPTGKILDPCKGDGAFYNCLPSDSEYCEITEGKDFFNYDKKVDWVIGNPPYSMFEEFLKHSFEIADNVSFLVPTNKVFQRQKIMNMINEYGGIYSIIIYGSGSVMNFPFGFSVGNFYFKKNYTGNTNLLIGIEKIDQLLGRGENPLSA